MAASEKASKEAESKLRLLHNESVARIQEDVARFRRERKHFRVYHGATSSTRTLDLQRDAIVDTSSMNRLFPVNEIEKTVQCEPNVPMDALLAHTLKVGLVPKVVMELKGITVGGGFSGSSGESSTFKYGQFQNIVSEIEIVLGDGTLETATRTHNEDLLENAGGCLGTLGVVTLATVELIDAMKYVNVVISRIDGGANIVPSMDAAIASTPEPNFVDGIHFSKDRIVMMVGHMSNTAQTKPFKKMEVHWFSTQVEKRISDVPTTITLSLTDYLFRYDHGAFWGAQLAFKHYHMPNIAPLRRLLDPILDARTCYHALHKTGLAAEYVVQDFGVTKRNVSVLIDYFLSVMPELQFYICPAQTVTEMGLVARGNPPPGFPMEDRMYGVGVYGRGPRDPQAFYDLNRQLEARSWELMASKLLYARTYFTEEEFWVIYNKEHHDATRRKWRAVVVDENDEKGGEFGLPNVYQKLSADMSKPIKMRSVMGVLETVRDKFLGRKEYLLPKH